MDRKMDTHNEESEIIKISHRKTKVIKQPGLLKNSKHGLGIPIG